MTASERLTQAAARLCSNHRLQLDRELGSGAFKCAFLVRKGDECSALKVADFGSDGERLEREVVALASCTHPGVARIISAGTFDFDGETFWAVFEEYLAGGTLKERLAVCPVSRDMLRGIGLHLADVLGHLRLRNLVHRDIKPANILFRDAGWSPVLTDFGLVRILDAPSVTADFMAQGPGTPAYAAPEQLLNEKSLIDWRTDQFDLGLVLAECLLGRHVFSRPRESLQDAIRRVARKEPVPAENAAQLRDIGFEALLTALQPWPVQRFRRPEDLVAALST